LAGRFLRFVAVGSIGFLVDSSVLLLLTSTRVAGPSYGRVLSFLAAATVTWKLNRSYTFRAVGGQPHRQWAQYVLATAIGAVINFAIYRLWLRWTDTGPLNLLLGVAAGSIGAMLFNFGVSHKFVFRSQTRTDCAKGRREPS